MRMLYLHPTGEAGRGGHTCLAFFDVELTEDCRLYSLRLMRMRDGRHLVYAPQVGQRRTATFSPELAEKLTTMAIAAMEGQTDAA